MGLRPTSFAFIRGCFGLLLAPGIGYMIEGMRTRIGVVAAVIGLLVLAILVVFGIRAVNARKQARLVSLRRQNLESLLRPSQNRELGFELIPNRSVTLDGVRYEINSLGFRDQERNIERVERSVRILVLGGNAAFGWGLPRSATVAAELEHGLNMGLESTIEVINCAVPGYDVHRCTRLLTDRLYLLAPDAVVLLFSLPELLLDPRAPELVQVNGAAGLPDWCPGPGIAPRSICHRPCPGELRREMETIANEARSRAYSVIWAVLPPLGNPQDESCRRCLMSLGNAAQEQGFVVVDLGEVIAALPRSGTPLSQGSPWEPSQWTSRVVANAIWTQMVGNRLVPTPLQMLDQFQVD